MTNNTILAMVTNRLRHNLRQLNHKIPDEDTIRLARFLLEDLDAAQWRLVPLAPTQEMVTASMTAMRKRRKRNGKVAERPKHAWRLAAGIEAAPQWDITKQPSSATLGIKKSGGFETVKACSLMAMHGTLEPSKQCRMNSSKGLRPS